MIILPGLHTSGRYTYSDKQPIVYLIRVLQPAGSIPQDFHAVVWCEGHSLTQPFKIQTKRSEAKTTDQTKSRPWGKGGSVVRPPWGEGGSVVRPPRGEGGAVKKLANDRSSRARHRNRFAGFHHLGALALIGRGTCRNCETGDRNAGHKRHDHDLEMGRAISRVHRVVHDSLQAPLPSPC